MAPFLSLRINPDVLENPSLRPTPTQHPNHNHHRQSLLPNAASALSTSSSINMSTTLCLSSRAHDRNICPNMNGRLGHPSTTHRGRGRDTCRVGGAAASRDCPIGYQRSLTIFVIAFTTATSLVMPVDWLRSPMLITGATSCIMCLWANRHSGDRDLGRRHAAPRTRV